jgi:hypothetical protein
MVMGRHRKRRKAESSRKCEVKGCDNESARSLPKKKLESYLSHGFKDNVGRRAHICKDHYKEYKKKSKKDRDLDRLGLEQGGIGPY